MNNALHLIPRPVHLETAGSGLRLSSLATAQYAGLDENALMLLLGKYPGLAASCMEQEGFALILGDAPEAATVPAKPDAYVLRVTEGGVRIDANDAASLFYGVQTLLQLPDDCPGLVIEDWAAIPLRMIHWDLKGYLPKFAVLKQEMYRLAAYKVNAILLEIEDKYNFRCAPEIAVPGAYTFEQLRELSVLCKSLHIAVVPKLQSIAHVDYILKHERYRHLRENGHVFQFCPANPEVDTLWRAMCDELMECFAEHGPYFHIGADEPGNLGECPECQKLGKAGSYLSKVSRCIEYVCGKGWTPVMWDDIVRNAGSTFTPEEAAKLRAELGKQSVIQYWQYGYGAADNTLPYIEEYQSANLRVWGASGYGGCDNWAGSFPPVEIRAQNCDAWAKAAVEHGIDCVCATGWTRIGSADCPAEPQESAWISIIYAAASMWNPETDEYRSLIRNAFAQLYGVEPDEALANALFNIKRFPYDYRLARKAEGESDAVRFLRYAAAIESLDAQRGRLENFLQYYPAKLGTRLEDYRLHMLNNLCRGLQKDLQALRQETGELFSLYYEDVTVQEVLSTRFDWLERLNNYMISLLDKTEPV